MGGPIPLPGQGSQQAPNDNLFFWIGLEVQRQSRLRQPPEHDNQPGRAHRRSERVPREPRPEPESPSVVNSRRLPGRGHAGTEQRPHSVRHAARTGDGQPLSAPELHRSRQSLQLRLQRARADNRVEARARCGLELDATRKRTRHRRATPKTSRVRAAPGRRRCGSSCRPRPRAAIARAVHRPHVVQVLSATLTQEALATLQRQTLDNATRIHRDSKDRRSESASTGSSPIGARYVPWSTPKLGRQPARRLRRASMTLLCPQRRAALRPTS